MDPANFDDPNTFRPERFIDKNNGKFAKSNKVIPFGVGVRRCPGETLARAELFLFLTNLVQAFQLRSHGPVDFSTVNGVMFTTVPFKVDFTQR